MRKLTEPLGVRGYTSFSSRHQGKDAKYDLRLSGPIMGVEGPKHASSRPCSHGGCQGSDGQRAMGPSPHGAALRGADFAICCFLPSRVLRCPPLHHPAGTGEIWGPVPKGINSPHHSVPFDRRHWTEALGSGGLTPYAFVRLFHGPASLSEPADSEGTTRGQQAFHSSSAKWTPGCVSWTRESRGSLRTLIFWSCFQACFS